MYPIGIVNNREVAPKGKKFLNFGEEDSFSKYEIAVTYRHSASNKNLIPDSKSHIFKNFTEKLKSGKGNAVEKKYGMWYDIIH